MFRDIVKRVLLEFIKIIYVIIVWIYKRDFFFKSGFMVLIYIVFF